MGGRGASSMPSISGRDKAETRFIKQLAKDFDLMPNGDVQAEAEAYAMRKVGAENIREVFNESDRLLRLAREQQDIDYVNNLKISESVSENKTGYFGNKGEKTYHYRVTNKDGQTSHYEFKSKQTRKQLRQHILDDMTSIPLF